MKALESQQIKTATAGKGKERMEMFDGGGEGKSRALLVTVRRSHRHIPTTYQPILIAGTIQTVLYKGFDEEFLVEVKQRLMETPYQINAFQGKHKCSFLEMLNTKGGDQRWEMLS